MKINPGNTRGLLVPQGDRPFSFVVYSSEIRDFGLNIGRKEFGDDWLKKLVETDKGCLMQPVTVRIGQ